MSDRVTEQTLTAAGRTVRLLTRGSGSLVVLLLHTGAPAASPFLGSSDLFADLMNDLDLDAYRLIAPDLPGAGGTEVLALDDLLPDGVAQFVGDVVAELGTVDELHLLAHGQSSLAALKVAREGAGSVPVTSCFLVAPNSAAPIGDSIQNVSLLCPPAPMWSVRSQRWAVRRLAYVPGSVPESLLEIMVANADGAPHGRAVELLKDPVNASALFGSQLGAQDEFYAYCRDEQYTVPISIFWGAQDPTASISRGTVLADILGGGPQPLDFHLVNQCAHLAQFDRPFQLARVIETTTVRVSLQAQAASAP